MRRRRRRRMSRKEKKKGKEAEKSLWLGRDNRNGT